MLLLQKRFEFPAHSYSASMSVLAVNVMYFKLTCQIHLDKEKTTRHQRHFVGSYFFMQWSPTYCVEENAQENSAASSMLHLSGIRCDALACCQLPRQGLLISLAIDVGIQKWTKSKKLLKGSSEKADCANAHRTVAPLALTLHVHASKLAAWQDQLMSQCYTGTSNNV